LSQETAINPDFQDKLEECFITYAKKVAQLDILQFGYTKLCIQLGFVLKMSPPFGKNPKLDEEWNNLHIVFHQ